MITTQRDSSAKYLGYLKTELEMMGGFLNPRRKVVQLHFGGGTPTFLAPDELRELGRMIHERFEFAGDAEVGIEIDPRELTYAQTQALRETGFNRASIGVQDHDHKVQTAVHRVQPFEQTKQAVDWIREAGFVSLNVDLIYGLPYQTTASFEKTLDETLKLKPDRLAVFSYAHVPWLKPSQKIFAGDALPGAELKLELLKLTIEKLGAEGFVYIGMDHFAKETDELTVAQRKKTLQRNFQGYSTHGGADIYAFGMSAISQADGIYWQNRKELPEYYKALDEGRSPMAKGYIMTEDDVIRRETIMRLMCDMGLDYAGMSENIGQDFKAYFAKELASLDDLESDGLVTRTDASLTVTDVGRLLIRNIAMRFDAYQSATKEGKFSKTI